MKIWMVIKNYVIKQFFLHVKNENEINENY